MYYEDEIYHSGYLDGYYDSMELYHSDEEMTEEERKARRRRRRRNIALGVAGVAGAGAAGYAVGRALRKRRGSSGYIVPRGSRPSGGPSGSGSYGPRLGLPGHTGGSNSSMGPSGSRPRGPRPTGPRLTGPTLKRVHVDPSDIEIPIGWDFKRNKPKYRSDNANAINYEDYKTKKKYEEWDGNNNKVRELYNEFYRDMKNRRRRP